LQARAFAQWLEDGKEKLQLRHHGPAGGDGFCAAANI
jgi:hypothetical protein